MVNIMRRITAFLCSDCVYTNIPSNDKSRKTGDIAFAKFQDGFNYKAKILSCQDSSYLLCYNETVGQRIISQHKTTIIEHEENMIPDSGTSINGEDYISNQTDSEEGWEIIANNPDSLKLFFQSTNHLFDIVGHKIAFVHNRNLLLTTKLQIGWAISKISDYSLVWEDNVSTILRAFLVTDGFFTVTVDKHTLWKLHVLQNKLRDGENLHRFYQVCTNIRSIEKAPPRWVSHHSLAKHLRSMNECKSDIMLYMSIPEFRNIHQYVIRKKMAIMRKYSPWIIGHISHLGIKPHILINEKGSYVSYDRCKHLGQQRIERVFNISSFNIFWSQFGGQIRKLRNYNIRYTFEFHSNARLDLSGCDYNDEDTYEIADCIEKNCVIQEMLLYDNVFSKYGMDRIIRGLSRNDTINYIDISYISLSTGNIKALVSLLNIKPHLTIVIQGSITARCTEVRHNMSQMSDDQITIIMSICRKYHSLRSLKLHCNRITCKGAGVIASYIKQHSSLQILNLWSNNIGDTGLSTLAEAIVYNTHFADLSLGDNKFTHTGFQSFLEVTRNHPSLHNLWPPFNNLGDQCAEFICKTLVQNSIIKILNLNGTKLGDIGVSAISNGLSRNKILSCLRLGFNEITHIGAKDLADAVKGNISLVDINLSYCDIGPSGAAAFAQVLKVNSTLEVLDLGSNAVGDVGVIALSEGIAQNNTLKSLRLYGNNISHLGARSMSTVLEHQHGLKELAINHNNVGDLGAQAICTSLQSNSTLLYLELEHNNIKQSGTIAIVHLLNQNTIIKRILYDDCCDTEKHTSSH